MNFEILINNENIKVYLEHKKKLKNIYLRIIDNKTLKIRANKYFSLYDAKAFVVKKHAWIEKHLENKKYLNKNEYYYLGVINQNSDDLNIKAFYKKQAIELLPSLVDKHSFLMNLFPSSLKFRDNKTRWGSCSFKNAISLNINLMKFPQEVIEYVIIHELAHIKHKNHSRDFWNEVEIYCENYKILDKKLKEY